MSDRLRLTTGVGRITCHRSDSGRVTVTATGGSTCEPTTEELRALEDWARRAREAKQEGGSDE